MKKVSLVAFSLLFTACGPQPQTPTQSTQNIAPHAANDTPSKLGDRPYHVAIFHGGTLYCNGIIIAQNWVLAGIDCIPRKRWAREEFTVRVGSIDAQKGGQLVKVKSEHRRYPFALFELASDLELNENVAIAALPTKEIEAKHAALGQSLIFSRWKDNVLIETPLQVVTHKQWCENEERICGTASSKYAPREGAPWVKKINNRFYVFGVFSMRHGGFVGDVSVFASTAHFQPQITAETGILPEDGRKSEEKIYEGIFEKPYDSHFFPNDQGFETKGSPVTAKLLSNAKGDFDLYLQKQHYDGRWIDILSSEKDGHDERITYSAPAGKYRWEVYSYKGSGKYKLTTSKK